jgi:ankyrin repeat protein
VLAQIAAMAGNTTAL